MQVFRQIDYDAIALVGWGVQVMLVTTDEKGAQGPVARRLSGLGGNVDSTHEVFTGLAALIDDPFGYGLFVMECDALGGLDAGRRAAKTLLANGVRVPVILISEECPHQIFPQERADPILLRAPLTLVSLRVGFEHALRDRLMRRVA